MNIETPRPTYIALPMDDDDLSCPPAPYLSSCSNFHSPSPVSFSQHRFCFSNNDDLDCDTPVLRKVSSGRLPIGGNLLGLFIEEKGVLEAAVERIEYDPRYSSVFEEEDEDDLSFDLSSPSSSPPALLRRGSGYTSSDASSNGDLSPPPPTSSWHDQTHKVLVYDNNDADDVEIVEHGSEQDLRPDEDENSFESSLMSWRIPAYLREPESTCTSSASTPSFCSLTPIPYDNMFTATTDAYTYHDIEPTQDLSISLESLSVPSTLTRRCRGEGPDKRRKLQHRSARVINGSLFS